MAVGTVIASNNFLVPNGTFIVEFIAFIGVILVLAKYVLPPLQKSMNERQQAISSALSNAEEAKEKADEAQAEARRIIEEARTQARGVVEEANRLAERLRAEKREQADQEYERILSRARADIDAEARRATEELRGQIADLTFAVVEKVLGEGLDQSTHRAVIDRAIAEVEAETGSGVGASS